MCLPLERVGQSSLFKSLLLRMWEWPKGNPDTISRRGDGLGLENQICIPVDQGKWYNDWPDLDHRAGHSWRTWVRHIESSFPRAMGSNGRQNYT